MSAIAVLGTLDSKGAEHAFVSLDGKGHQVRCLKIPIDISTGGNPVLVEVPGGGTNRAAHASRFRRPSMSLLART